MMGQENRFLIFGLRMMVVMSALCPTIDPEPSANKYAGMDDSRARLYHALPRILRGYAGTGTKLICEGNSWPETVETGFGPSIGAPIRYDETGKTTKPERIKMKNILPVNEIVFHHRIMEETVMLSKQEIETIINNERKEHAANDNN